MGFFNLFKKSKEIEIVEFKELEAWLDNFLAGKKLEEKMDSLNEQTIMKIAEIREALGKLENASLLNDKIPERAKQIMEGNRKNYVRRINYFLDNFKLPENVLEISDFSTDLTEQLTSLSEETKKNYYVLKEFMEHDAYAVAKQMKELEDIMKKTSEDLEKENISTAENTKNKIKHYNKDVKTREILEKDLKEEEAKIEEFKAKEEKINRKIAELKKSKDLEKYNDLIEKEEKVLEGIKNQEQKFFELFSVLERPLKKYKRSCLEEGIINKYLDEHIKTFREDEELKLLEILDKLKQNIKSLELKEKNEQKVMETINILDKDFLDEIRTELDRLDQGKKDIRHEMSQSVIMMNLVEQESFLENNQTLMDIQKRKIEELKNKKNNIQPEEIKKEIKEELKEIVNVIIENETTE